MKTALYLIVWLFALEVAVADQQAAVALQLESLADYPEITVFSLDPSAKPGQPLFRGQTILGSAKLEEEADRTELLRAFANSIRESNGDPFACFIPRHGLRFSKNGVHRDIVICFECASSQVHGFRLQRIFHTSSAQPVFDRFLTANGIELAKKPNAERDAAPAD